jgi:hypothetical protein
MAKAIHVCTRCGEAIEYDDSVSLYEVALEHASNCKGPSMPREHKKITDVLPPEVFKGNLVTMEEILGLEVLVIDMTWRDSTYQEDAQYLSLTILWENEARILNTGAERVVQVFKQLKHEALPVYVCFEKITLPNGRRVYRVKV